MSTMIVTGTGRIVKAPGDTAFSARLHNPDRDTLVWAVDRAEAQAKVAAQNAFALEHWTLPTDHPVQPPRLDLLD